MTATASLQGVDVSHWQNTINWDDAAPWIDFAMVKATQGVNDVDAEHAANVAGLRAHNKLLGHYHYPDGGDAAAEADFFIANAARQGGEVQELDFEGDILEVADPVGWAAAFFERVIAKTNNRPLIYMSAATVTRFDWARVNALDIGLHVADWNTDTPKPGSWPFIIERQTTDKGSVPGISGAVDKDVFYGTGDTWHAYGAEIIPEPAPEPEPAPQPAAPEPGGLYEVVPGDNLTIIANRFHVTVVELVDWNEGSYPSLRTNANLIISGWVLHVAGAGPAAGTAPANTPAAPKAAYTVVHGDNLTLIAKHAGVTVAELVDWNEARYPSLRTNDNLIGVGWTLKVSP